MVELVESSRGRMVELWNRRMVEWWSFGSCRIIDSSNGGVGVVVESSNSRIVE